MAASDRTGDVAGKGARHHSSTRVSLPPDERRAQIVSTAQKLFETQGINQTSIRDITQTAGISRGLFYYYFPDKTAVAEAVMDVYTAEYIAHVDAWNSSRRLGDVKGAAHEAVKLFRRVLAETDAPERNLSLSMDTRMYYEFVDRVISKITDTILQTTVKEYAKYHTIEIDCVYEEFYVLIYGIVGLLKKAPETSDDTIEKLIEQSLHLDTRTATPHDSATLEDNEVATALDTSGNASSDQGPHDLLGEKNDSDRNGTRKVS